MADSGRSCLLPVIRRARGFRLYDAGGRRFLDLYRDGGGAILGHRAGAAGTAMKSVLSQGLAVPLPTAWEGRLVKMIGAMFPRHGEVRLFASRARALDALTGFLGMRVRPEDLHDPALDGPCSEGARAALWRPFLPEADASVDPRIAVLPVLPLTICGAPSPVCFPTGAGAALPPGDHLPGFILAGAARAIADLAGLECFPGAAAAGVEKAIDGSACWKRRGPYVRALFDPERYPSVFDAFLREGVLLSPGHPGPSILPGECSPGETRLLARLFAGIPGG